MRVIQMTATAGPDGVLRLEVPAVGAGAECEVVVQVRPAAVGAALAQTPEERGWPRDFIQNVLGSIDDDSFMIRPQPPVPSPLEAFDEVPPRQ